MIRFNKVAAQVPLVAIGLLACNDRQQGSSTQIAPHEFATTQPILMIGTYDSLSGHSLHGVTGALRISDGRLMIADGASAEVRVFDVGGTLQRTLAGQGFGRGQHVLITTLWQNPDGTFSIHDVRTGRISTWNLDGSLAREFAIPAGLAVIGPLPGGSLLGLRSDPASKIPPGESRVDSASLVVIDTGSLVPTDIARVPWRTTHAAEVPTGGVIQTPLPFEPEGSVAIGSDRIYVGYGSEWSLQVLSATGQIVGELLVDGSIRPLAGAIIQSWKDEHLERTKSSIDRPIMVKYLNSLPYPPTLPAYDRLLTDEAGNIWLRTFPLPGSDSTIWTVVSQSGDYIGRLLWPTASRPLHIGHDFIVALVPRSDGAEQVGVFQLRR